MKKILLIVSLALLTVLSGCNKEDKLWDAINDLKGRVEALETQVKQLNVNVLALTELHKTGATVTAVEKDAAGVWKITLSNGSVLDLKQGTEAEATIPVMAINTDGNWEVSYDNGVTFTEIKVDGNAVKAAASTPVFRIDASGFWEVSYDEGTTYGFVRDAANQKVNAIKDGNPTDSFFKSVELKDGNLVIKMLNDQIISVPIIKDFYYRIINVGGDIISVAAGATHQFNVEFKGVDNTIITAPEGWVAKLSDVDAIAGTAKLNVTAPGGVAPIRSRATADNSKDVAVLATSNKYATIAKVQVQLAGSLTPPTITAVAEDVLLKSATSLSFTFTLSTDALGVKYLCLPSTTAAPSVVDITTSGTVVSGATAQSLSVTVAELTPLTEYTIYAVAYKGTSTLTYSDAKSSATATTKTDVVDYWEEGVMINGVKYDKNSTGAELLTVPASATEDVDLLPALPTATRVLFLDTPLSATYAYTLKSKAQLTTDYIVIGRTSKSMPKVSFGASGFLPLRGTGITVALKNLTLDTETRNSYIFNNEGAADGNQAELLLIEDCKFTKVTSALFYRSVVTAGVKSIVMKNNIIKIKPSLNGQLFNIGNTSKSILYKNFEFSNNIVYTDAGVNNTSLFSITTATQQVNAVGDTWDNSFKVTNNTFVNVYGGNGLIVVRGLANLNISKNIFHMVDASSTVAVALYSAIYNGAGAGETVPGIVNEPTTLFGSNIVFGGNDGQNWDHYKSVSSLKEPATNNRITKATSAPLTTVNTATGTFVRSAEMITSGIGSTLK